MQHTPLLLVLLLLLCSDAVLTPAAAPMPATTRPATSTPDILQRIERLRALYSKSNREDSGKDRNVSEVERELSLKEDQPPFYDFTRD